MTYILDPEVRQGNGPALYTKVYSPEVEKSTWGDDNVRTFAFFETGMLRRLRSVQIVWTFGS